MLRAPLSVRIIEYKEFPWHLEVKCPTKFKLIKNEGSWEGNYKDQNGFESTFSLVTDINNGREMILCHSGETKSPEAWAPIHKIKLIEGKIVGVTITDKYLFSWEAVRIVDR